MFCLFRKIRDAIALVMFLYTLYTSLRGFAALGRELVQELKYQWRRRTSDLTRFESSLR